MYTSISASRTLNIDFGLENISISLMAQRCTYCIIRIIFRDSSDLDKGIKERTFDRLCIFLTVYNL